MHVPRALLLSLPVALLGGWAAASGAGRIAEIRSEMARLEVAGRSAGESFVKTFEGAQAERQLEAYDRRRALALELARARRDEILGLLGVGAAALLHVGLSLMRRIAAEVEEERRAVGQPPRPPKGGA
ncbi:MAG TPA: hypothetical protein VH880_09510 [Anaeromyxobacteraceae bacterium]|jgi:hypothetical protein